MGTLGACHSFFTSLCAVGYSAEQQLLGFVCQLKEWRNDSDCFQKINQIAVAYLKSLTIYDPAVGARFGGIVKVCTATAGMHDFYRFMQYPRFFTHPIEAGKIDEEAVFASLASQLVALGVAQPFLTTDGVETLQGIIKDQLEGMRKQNRFYSSTQELVNALEEKLKEVAQEHFALNPNSIDLSALRDDPALTAAWVKKTSWVGQLENMNWTAVDLLSAAWWLKEWELVNFEDLSSRVGQYATCRFLGSASLDQWLIGGVCSGFALKLAQSIRALTSDSLTASQRIQKQWDVASSIAEFVFYAALFVELVKPHSVNALTIQLLALAAKSIGVASLIKAPKRVYFETSAA